MAQQRMSGSITGKLLTVIGITVVIVAVVLGGYLYFFRSQLADGKNVVLAESLQAQVDTQIKGKLDILITTAITLAHNDRVVDAFVKDDYTISEHEL